MPPALHRSLIVVAYDVGDDRIRNRMAKILLGAGARRVQKSLFELETDAKSLAKLRRRLGRLRGQEDRIAYYRLCGSCRREAIYVGPDAKSGEKRGTDR